MWFSGIITGKAGYWAYFVAGADNILKMNGFNGIYLYKTNESIIRNNKCISNGQHKKHEAGVSIANSYRCTITSNYTANSYNTHTQYFGVLECKESDYNIIEKNKVENVKVPYKICGKHTYCDQVVYRYLPKDGFSVRNKVIHYSNGKKNYLAIWDGTKWLLTHLEFELNFN